MYRKNTAGQFIGFVAINAATGATMTGTTGFAAFRVLDGGAQAAATGTVTDKSNGQYSFALSQADTNGSDCSILFTMTGMIAVEKTFITTVLDPTSTAFGLALAKGTNLTGLNDIAATAIVSAGAITTAGGAVSSVITVGTLITYTGNTPQTGDSFARIGATGSGLTSLAPSSTALSTAQWTNTRAGNLDNLDAAVSTRSTYAGGPVFSVTAPVTVGTNSDKTGYALSSTGLDAIGTTAPTGPATTFPAMVIQLWRRFFAASAKSALSSQITTFAADGTTVLTTQHYTDDGLGNETLGAAS